MGSDIEKLAFIKHTKEVFYSHDKPISSGDQLTNTFLPIPGGATVTILAWGGWDIYSDPGRVCGPPGSGIPANNGGEHGDWPAAGFIEGCLLICADGRIFDKFVSSDYTGTPGVFKKVVTFPGGNLGFGPNDNWLMDNSGSLTVRISWE